LKPLDRQQHEATAQHHPRTGLNAQRRPKNNKACLQIVRHISSR
jgi:hypothetical protein